MEGEPHTEPRHSVPPEPSEGESVAGVKAVSLVRWLLSGMAGSLAVVLTPLRPSLPLKVIITSAMEDFGER